MFSSIVRLIRGRRGICDCCNHNIDIAALLDDEDGSKERQTVKKKLTRILSSLRWSRVKKKYQIRNTTTRKTIKDRMKHVYKRAQHMGKKRSIGTHSRQAPRANNAIIDTKQHADPLKPAIRQLLTTMFGEIVENDRTLAKQTDMTTQCFLVHALLDLDPKGSFLGRYGEPSPQMFDLDLDLGLSFVSSWLQSSLANIKTSYTEGKAVLQMPFCVLETTQSRANMRARALQRSNPDEKVGIATLDIVALNDLMLVVSAQHTFDFLRVSRLDFHCGKKLLAGVEGGEDGQSASALRSTVLTVVEWEDTDEVNDVESELEELRMAVQTSLPDGEQRAKWVIPREKKDSGTVSRTASGSLNGSTATPQGSLTAEEDRYMRFRSV